VAAATPDGAVRIWDVATARQSRLLRGAGPAISLTFSRDGRSLAVVGRNRHVQVWDRVPGRAQQVRARKVTAASFSPDGRRLVTAGKDNFARIWDLRTGTLVGSPLAGHTKPLTFAAYSPNARYIVTTSFDHDARVWDARTGRLVWTLRGHSGVISNATFSSDSRWVLTAGPGSAAVWDMTTGRALFFLNGRDRRLTSAAFSPRGWRIVTGGSSGRVKTYDCRLCGNIDDLIAIAQQRLANLRH
jgi:WD40 repeat protein